MYERIRAWREDNDITQKEMARRLSVHQTTYSEYELGKTNIPAAALSEIADMMRTSVDYILGRTDVIEPYPKAGESK